ncbi:ATP-dependent DNA helicase RecQ [Tepidibacillus sp. HK-1]|nr:ATP-dependent DNA helicase RecQ [Tepidibacillus sp. HK-1]GBF11584.1 ATP-dependent DNA helicase RecQ [Tepidibacillus sp. HK-1]
MLTKYLSRYFGYDSFRDGQEEIIQHLLKGEHVLGVLPTGGGKSICYQLPALLFPGITIVVSPLISLMEDQVIQLKNMGLFIATYINSQLSYEEIVYRLKGLEQGKTKILYVSPEKLQQEAFFNRLKKMNISLFVVDEAHCISQWGHDFRTDYLRLRDYIVQLNEPTVLALTATATPIVQEDIIEQLGLQQMYKIVTSLDRKNIAYEVIQVDTIEEKKVVLFNLLEHLQGPGIIYVNTRLTSEWLSDELKRNGFNRIEAYHAGLPNEDRLIIQQQFMREDLNVIIATKAFGMGINKKNVRFVIHYDIPANIESYLQETGRVGRDGKQGYAALIYQKGDEETSIHLIDNEYPDKEKIQLVCQQINQQKKENNFRIEDFKQGTISEQQLELIFFYLEKMGHISWLKTKSGYKVQRNEDILSNRCIKELEQIFEQRKRKRYGEVNHMIQFVNQKTCRRLSILEYFYEQNLDKPAFCCDICGIKIEKIFEKREKTIQYNAWSWEQELSKLLPISRSAYEKERKN